MERVSLIQVKGYEYEQVRKAIVTVLEPLGGMSAFVKPGDRVLLKPNMLAGKTPRLAVTTNPVVVRVVAELVLEAGGRVSVGDSPGIGSFKRVAAACGIADAVRECGADLVEFGESVEVSGDGLFRRISIAKAYWEADKIINLPKLKTHEMMTMTCAVKNLFGAVVGTEKAGWHLKAGASREQFARLLLEICQLKMPTLNIVDAIIAMEGDGPGSGDPIDTGFMLAGVNPVAVDVVAGRIAGIPADLLHVEQEALRMGLAGARFADIELCGPALESIAGRSFKLPTGMDVQFGLPKFIAKGLKRYLTSYPIAAKGRCVLCGVCRDACPPAAITIKNSALSVDNVRCIRCWCCRELCPHDAMSLHRGWLLRVLEAVARR